MDFKTEPFKHQLEAFELSKDKEVFALFCEAGTGKTKILIDTAAWLKLQGKVNCTVVVTTNNVHIKWIDEIKQHCPINSWAIANKTSTFNFYKNLLFESSDASFSLPFVCFNFESLLNKENQNYLITLCKKKKVLLIIDESHKIRNPKTQVASFLHKLSDLVAYKRIATGTPTGNEKQFNLYSQFLFLDPKIINASSYWGFKNTYGDWVSISIGQPHRRFKKLVKYKNLDRLMKKIQPHTYIKTKKECLDLPDKVYMQYPVEISRQQVKDYNNMLQTGTYNLEDYHFLSSSKLTDLMKMQQILSGFLLLEDSVIEIIVAKNNPKWKAIIDLLEDIEGKVIIWSRFKYEINSIMALIRDTFKDEDICEKLDGDIDANKRIDIVKKFQDESSGLKYIVANNSCNIEGLDMFAADTMIYVSNSFSWLNRSQSEDRIHRIGQKNQCTYIDIVVPESIDIKILETLKQCKNVTNDLYFEIVNGQKL